MVKLPTVKSKLLKVRADTLRIHPTAQRDILPSRLKKFLAELDLDAIGVLHAVEYAIGGEMALWIVDGQHRWRALIDHGFGEWTVEVKVHVDVKDDAKASALFLKLNDRAVVSPYARYRNELKAGQEDAVGVDNIVGRFDLEVSNYKDDSRLTCPVSLKKVYNVDEGSTLNETLKMIVSAWGSKSAALEGKVIEGLAMVLSRYNGVMEKEVMSKKLSKYPGGASGIVGDARGLQEFRKVAIPRCIAERIIETYNKGRKSGLLEKL